MIDLQIFLECFLIAVCGKQVLCFFRNRFVFVILQGLQVIEATKRVNRENNALVLDELVWVLLIKLQEAFKGAYDFKDEVVLNVYTPELHDEGIDQSFPGSVS